jgi:hypothetical protein
LLFETLLTVVAFLAGAVASVVGFGIGSLLTPVLSLRLGVKLAVAAIAIPHALGTGLRLWQLKGHINRKVILTFGLASAGGGLIGALLHAFAHNPVLTMIFAVLLVFAGMAGVTGLAERMRFRGWMAWGSGGLSGVLGGLVGNQGGIRSAALLGFELSRDAFVATATMVALMVDFCRVPVYLAAQGEEMAEQWFIILLMSIGVLAGTLVGRRLLAYVPEKTFRRVVSVVILLLGAYMGIKAGTLYV